MNPDIYTLLSNANWRPEHIPAAAEWLREYLAANLKGHATWRTADLYKSLDIQPEQTRTVTNALYKIRKSGLIDDCFRRDDTKRHMGKPLVIWMRPLATSPTDSSAGNIPAPVSEEDF